MTRRPAAGATRQSTVSSISVSWVDGKESDYYEYTQDAGGDLYSRVVTITKHYRDYASYALALDGIDSKLGALDDVGTDGVTKRESVIEVAGWFPSGHIMKLYRRALIYVYVATAWALAEVKAGEGPES